MRCDLVAGFVGVLQSGFLVVDAAVEGAGDEEGPLGSPGVERVYEFLGVLIWAIVVG